MDTWHIPIGKPEWFVAGCKEAEREFSLINKEILPKSLQAKFVLTMCLRLLRAIFGTESNAEAIKQFELYNIENEKQIKLESYLADHEN